MILLKDLIELINLYMVFMSLFQISIKLEEAIIAKSNDTKI